MTLPAATSARAGRRAALWLAWCLAWGVAVPGWATTPDAWKAGAYAFNEPSATLGAVLKAFARSMNVTLRVAAGVPVRSRWIGGDAPAPLTPEGFLDRLAGGHALQYFVFNETLYVSTAASAKVDRIDLGATQPDAARDALTGLGLYEAKFGWGPVEGDETSAVIVAGPPAYAALVRRMLAQAVHVEAASVPTLMLFRLHYATAEDTEFELRDRKVHRPGVASTLRELLNDPSAPESGSNPVPPPGGLPVPQVAPSPGSPLPGLTDLLGGGPRSAPPSVPLPGALPRAAKRPAQPRIEAYAPLNAILVRDLPERRAMYQGLVSELDVRPRQVEIHAEIIDANVDALDQFWSQLSITTPVAGFGKTPGDPPDASGPSLALTAANRVSLGLRALQAHGDGRVLERPALLTLDNEPALLDLSQTALFRLVGERAVDLKTQTVGTKLMVTPRLLTDRGVGPIRLNIELEDGSFDRQRVGDSQLLDRGSLHTTAIVHPGQALVIGGYRRRATSNEAQRVPGLASVPLLGRLFRDDSQSDQTQERLLVITARVVDDPSTPSADGASLPSLQDELRPEHDPARPLR